MHLISILITLETSSLIVNRLSLGVVVINVDFLEQP